MKHGQVSIYSLEGDLKFQGHFTNGKANGFCMEYQEGKVVFEGEYKDGLKNGRGFEYDKFGKYSVTYNNGKKMELQPE